MNVYSNLLSPNSVIFLFRSATFGNWYSTKINMLIPFADDSNCPTDQNLGSWLFLKQMKFALL